MAYADPQTLTINSVANTLPRVGSGPNNGTFRKDDGTVGLSILQTSGKRMQHSAKFDFTKLSADPLISAQNVYRTMTVVVRVDRPLTGFTVAESKLNVDACFLWFTTASGLATTKILGGES